MVSGVRRKRSGTRCRSRTGGVILLLSVSERVADGEARLDDAGSVPRVGSGYIRDDRVQ